MILDLLFFAFIVLFAVLGFIFGLFKTLVSFFGWFISLLLSYLLAKAIANAFLSPDMAYKIISEGGLYDKVYNLVPEGLKNMSMESIRAAIQSGATEETIRETIKAESTGLLYFMSSLIQGAVCKEMYINSAIESVGQVFALELTYNIYVILTGIAFFFILRVVVMGLSFIFKSKLTGHEVKFWERLAGIAGGAVRGFAYACILLMVANYIAGIWPKMQEEVNNSKVSVPVTSWVSDATGKMIGGNLEDNKKYANLIEALENRLKEEKDTVEEQ